MAEAGVARAGLARAIARFPEAAATLRRLALISPSFREICEEYALAQQSLALFQARPVLWEGEACLAKPFTPQGLREAVAMALYGHLDPTGFRP